MEAATGKESAKVDVGCPLATGPVLCGQSCLSAATTAPSTKCGNHEQIRIDRNRRRMAVVLCAVRAEQPLYEEEPYDQITLDAANDNAVLKIKPLETAGSPASAPRKAHRQIDRPPLDKPDKEYTVSWRAIVKVELFEQLVLNKANDWSPRASSTSLRLLRFLERNKPNTPGLGKAMEDFLYEEAKMPIANSNTTAPWPCCGSCTAATHAGPVSTGPWG